MTRSSRARWWWTWSLAGLLAGSAGCAASCPQGRTMWNHNCVREEIVDFVSCVRDPATLKIAADKGVTVSQQAQLLGQSLGVTANSEDELIAEFDRIPEKQREEILKICGELTGRRSQNSKPETGGYWMAGAGAAVIVAGGYFVGRAASKNDESQPYCDGDVCRDPGFQLRQQARTAGNLATALILPGVGLLGAGLIWIVAAPSSDEPSDRASVQLRVGAGKVGLEGAW